MFFIMSSFPLSYYSFHQIFLPWSLKFKSSFAISVLMSGSDFRRRKAPEAARARRSLARVHAQEEGKGDRGAGGAAEQDGGREGPPDRPEN